MLEKFEPEGQRTEQQHAAVLTSKVILASLILSFISKFMILSISACIKIGKSISGSN